MIAAVLAGAPDSAPGGGKQGSKQGSKQGGKPQRGKKRAMPESSQPTLSKFFVHKVE